MIRILVITGLSLAICSSTSQAMESHAQNQPRKYSSEKRSIGSDSPQKSRKISKLHVNDRFAHDPQHEEEMDKFNPLDFHEVFGTQSDPLRLLVRYLVNSSFSASINFAAANKWARNALIDNLVYADKRRVTEFLRSTKDLWVGANLGNLQIDQAKIKKLILTGSFGKAELANDTPLRGWHHPTHHLDQWVYHNRLVMNGVAKIPRIIEGQQFDPKYLIGVTSNSTIVNGYTGEREVTIVFHHNQREGTLLAAKQELAVRLHQRPILVAHNYIAFPFYVDSPHRYQIEIYDIERGKWMPALDADHQRFLAISNGRLMGFSPSGKATLYDLDNYTSLRGYRSQEIAFKIPENDQPDREIKEVTNILDGRIAALTHLQSSPGGRSWKIKIIDPDFPDEIEQLNFDLSHSNNSGTTVWFQTGINGDILFSYIEPRTDFPLLMTIKLPWLPPD